MDGLELPAAVIFDLDGTLVDTVPARIDAWAAVFEERGIAATREQLGPLIGMDGVRLAIEVAAAAGSPVDRETAEAIDRRAGELFGELNREPRPLPGVAAAIARIEGHGIPWAIATSSRAEQVVASVRALGLEREPRVIDGSSVEHAKPAPDLLLAAARRLEASPEACWCVGDSTWDMRASVAAGMAGIGVLAGAAVSAADLGAAGAALVIGTLDELELPD